MPKTIPPLADTAIRKAKAGIKPLKLRDGGGLYLLITPAGSKLWNLDYRRPGTGKQNTVAVGAYPAVGLAEARAKRAQIRKLLAAGTDPAAKRHEAKATSLEAQREAANTFGAVAEAWIAFRSTKIKAPTLSKNRWLLDDYLLPTLRSRPIRDIKARELLELLRGIESTGKLEAAKRAKTKAGEIFRYAVLEGLADADPTTSLKGALQAPNTRHRASVTEPARIGELMRAIHGYPHFLVRHALLLIAMTFVRPGELRHARWEEFDLDAAEGSIWRIPGERMKMKGAHLVPLSTQAVSLLRDLKGITGGGALLFPGLRPGKPISDNTLNAALRTLGFAGDVHVAHGFRGTAATRLNEAGWNPDAIERQLAHAESNKVRAAYTSQAQYLPERRRMMQAYSDILDRYRGDASSLSLKTRAF